MASGCKIYMRTTSSENPLLIPKMIKRGIFGLFNHKLLLKIKNCNFGHFLYQK
uniref:Uncharacterized protein n=1 Tax=Arundo donax TaxID=35708 RepID=A0A0A8ZDW8_ARUDO